MKTILKLFAIIAVILVVCWCKNSPKQANLDVYSDVDVVKSETCTDTLIPLPLVKRTTISFATTNNKYRFFGMIGDNYLTFKEDTLNIPPIPGLVHKTGLNAQKCGRSYIYDYQILALRCPPRASLLKWMTRRLQSYFLIKAIPKRENKFQSVKEICSFFINRFNEYGNWYSDTTIENPYFYHQKEGLLIADCWASGDYYTFYEISWSNVNNLGHEAYKTVNQQTGEELFLNDFVDSVNYEKLSRLMLSRLVDEYGAYYIDNHSYENTVSFLECLSGCALIEEGFVLFFYPYIVGCGAEGEFEAIIPYEELRSILKRPYLEALGLDISSEGYTQTNTITSRVELTDENDDLAVYLMRKGKTKNDIDIVSIWLKDKKTSQTRLVYKDSINNIYCAHIIPNTDTCKLLIEGCPDMHNIYSYIVTEGKSDAVMLPSLGGLLGFANDEGVIIMQSYQYYHTGGRYSKIDAYDQYGNKIATMKVNLHPDLTPEN